MGRLPDNTVVCQTVESTRAPIIGEGQVIAAVLKRTASISDVHVRRLADGVPPTTDTREAFIGSFAPEGSRTISRKDMLALLDPDLSKEQMV